MNHSRPQFFATCFVLLLTACSDTGEGITTSQSGIADGYSDASVFVDSSRSVLDVYLEDSLAVADTVVDEDVAIAVDIGAGITDSEVPPEDTLIVIDTIDSSPGDATASNDLGVAPFTDTGSADQDIEAGVDTVIEPVDVEEPDIPPPPPVCSATVTINEPAMPNDFYVLGDGIQVSALVSDPVGNVLSAYQVEWRDDAGNVLGISSVDAAGQTSTVLTGVPKGHQDLHAQAIDANGPCQQEALHPIQVCSADVTEDFNASLVSPWVIFGDGSWSPSGYIEMTGIAQGKKGAVYNDAEYVYPGSVSIRFEVQTGAGSGSGADGFAMTIVETDDTNDLPVILSNAKSGGGLAYASQGSYGAPVVFKAFTVEIDTWYNVYNGNNEFHTDPTQDDHVELTLDLDAGQSIAFTSAGEIEDLAWHSIRVDVLGTIVKVWLDGVLKVEQDVPALDFRGGYIFFSGSTGYYTNYHRFDDLKIIHNCKAAPSAGT
jgi:hypothetical protein